MKVSDQCGRQNTSWKCGMALQSRGRGLLWRWLYRIWI